MNIVVCLKQVPGTTEVKINPETNTLIREGIKNIVNPFDTYALEEGVRLKERYGGKVTAITMGPPQAEDILREAVSLGADEVVLLSDRAFAGADTWATAYTLAAAVKKLAPYDLVICGRQTVDGDTGQVGPEMAEMLGVSFVAYASKVERVDGGTMRVQRLVEDGHEVIDIPLPGVITVTKEINVPRLPSLRGTLKAKNANVTTWNLQELGADEDKVGLAGSYTRVTKIFFPQRTFEGEMPVGDAESQVNCLIVKLRQANIT